MLIDMSIKWSSESDSIVAHAVCGYTTWTVGLTWAVSLPRAVSLSQERLSGWELRQRDQDPLNRLRSEISITSALFMFLLRKYTFLLGWHAFYKHFHKRSIRSSCWKVSWLSNSDRDVQTRELFRPRKVTPHSLVERSRSILLIDR